MNFQSQIESKLFKKNISSYKNYHQICYILAKEFGWSYNQMNNSPSPYVLELIDIWQDLKEKEIKASKRKRR